MAKQIEMMSADVELVSKLGDQPNQENGLTAEELKAVFDRGSKRLKEYVNGTLVPAVNELAESDGRSIKDDQLPKAINAALDQALEKLEAAFWVAAKLDYETGTALPSESAEAIYAAYEAKKPCYMRATVTNSVPGAYQILVLQSAQKGNTGNGGTHYRLVFQTTSSVEIESEVAGGWITCLYLDEVVVSSFDGTAQNVCFHTQISPNANALTIGEQVYDGSVAVDMTDNINSMIDAKGRILLYEWAGINNGQFPAGNLTATDMVGEYSGVEVLFYCKRGGSLVSSGFIPKDTLYPNGAVAIGVTDAGELVTRTVRYSGNVFTFGSAMIGTGADNRMMLPWRIYGYK